MNRLRDVLALYSQEQKPIVVGRMCLVSLLAAPCAAGQIELAWPSVSVPPEASELWSACCAAKLFADVAYGQWGLVLLDPFSSAARTAHEKQVRPSEYRPEDMIIGEFMGDSDVIVLCPSETGDRRVMIGLPLDPREDWYAVGPDLGTLLEGYFRAQGQKFWARRGN